MKPQPRYQRGDRIANRYQVHQALLGGMGEVYLCLDLEENLPYALKTFQQRYLTDPQRLRQAFEQEVATWIALEKHPNIVRCFYMTTLDRQPFMVLEWIAGEEGRGAFEVSGFWTDTRWVEFNRSSDTDGNPVLVRPFVNARTGQEWADYRSYPTYMSGTTHEDFGTQLGGGTDIHRSSAGHHTALLDQRVQIELGAIGESDAFHLVHAVAPILNRDAIL